MHGNLPLKNFDINDEDDSKWPHNLRTSRANLEKVYSNLRQRLKRKPEENGGSRYEYVDTVNVYDCHPTAAVHLGNDYLHNLHANKNQPQRTVKQLFDVASKFGQRTHRNSRNIPELFFTAVNPMYIDHYQEKGYEAQDCSVQTQLEGTPQNTVYWCNLRVAQSKG